MNTRRLKNFEAFNSNAYKSFQIYNGWWTAISILEGKTFMCSFVSRCKLTSRGTASRSVDRDQDRKIPPAPGTNQIAGFGSSSPLAR